MGNLGQTELRRLKRGKKRIRRENKTNTRISAWPLNRLKQGDDNELERNLRLEKVVTSKHLRLALGTEEERRAKLENDVATKRLRLAMETEEEGNAKLEKW